MYSWDGYLCIIPIINCTCSYDYFQNKGWNRTEQNRTTSPTSQTPKQASKQAKAQLGLGMQPGDRVSA